MAVELPLSEISTPDTFEKELIKRTSSWAPNWSIIPETFTYHVWYFWAAYVLKALLNPFLGFLPSDVLGVLCGGFCQWLWISHLTFKAPKEAEAVLLPAVRSRKLSLIKVTMELGCVAIGIYLFAKTWDLCERLAPTGSGLHRFISAPGLPDLKESITGYPLQHNDPPRLLFGALTVEFLLSTFHWWGIGLAQVARNARGLSLFRTFVTPTLVAFGRQQATGRPSLNSSVALIAALRRPSRARECVQLAAVDILAMICTVMVPRSLRSRAADKSNRAPPLRKRLDEGKVHKSRDESISQPVTTRKRK